MTVVDEGIPMLAASEFTLPRTGRILRNRTVLAAMTNKQSEDDGTLSDAEIEWLLMRARGGFGIVTTAATHVHPGGKSWDGERGVWGEHHIPRLTAPRSLIPSASYSTGVSGHQGHLLGGNRSQLV